VSGAAFFKPRRPAQSATGLVLTLAASFRSFRSTLGFVEIVSPSLFLIYPRIKQFMHSSLRPKNRGRLFQATTLYNVLNRLSTGYNNRFVRGQFQFGAPLSHRFIGHYNASRREKFPEIPVQ
jgi:hypothetical protein